MIQPSKRLLIDFAIAALAWAATGAPAGAQETPFPTGVIRLVAPNSAGTPPDMISRILAKNYQKLKGGA